jgi:hypothetical protein
LELHPRLVDLAMDAVNRAHKDLIILVGMMIMEPNNINVNKEKK